METCWLNFQGNLHGKHSVRIVRNSASICMHRQQDVWFFEEVSTSSHMHEVARNLAAFHKISQEAWNRLTHWFLLPGGGLPVYYIYIYIYLYIHIYIYVYICIYIYIYIFPKLALANGVLTVLYKGPRFLAQNVAPAAGNLCLWRFV